MARFTTERGLDRLVNFSDATIAIALTLLVLPLTDLAGEAGKEGLGPLLANHTGAIASFLLSFIVIAMMWIDHHLLFEWLVDYDRLLLLLNLVWLFAVVVLPFSTEALESQTKTDRVSSAIYAGNLFLGFTVSTVMRFVVRSRRHLINPERHAETMAVLPSIVTASVTGLTLIVALAAPGFGLWTLILVPVTRRIIAFLPKRT